MTDPVSIVLFNRDLRVRDHVGLHEASDRGRVLPVFVVDESLRSTIEGAPNRTRFLVEALDDLATELKKAGAPLVLRVGDPAAVVDSLADEVGADRVFTSADFTPVAQRRERRVDATRTPGVALVAPGDVTPAGGNRYQVFTPYWNRWREIANGRGVLGAPKLKGVEAKSDDIGWLRRIEPTAPDMATGGETAAAGLLDDLWRRLVGYADDGHDDLAGDRTSRLSPYLHFGCVSPRQVFVTAEKLGADGDALIRQLCWRDFFLQHEALEPVLGGKLNRGGTKPRPELLEAWQEGRTGYPLVDAGMRQLVREGWMHNRARMVVASFLTKDLQIDWWHGAEFFMRHLVDGDVTQNNGNWKWVAGVGTDTRRDRAFSPIRQQQRFDKRAEYIRRYLPEYDTPEYPDPVIPEEALAAKRGR